MGRELTHEEAVELLGAYALDAVDGEESDALERHLAGCAPCRAEVAGHREVVAFLAPVSALAPEGLWDRISGSLDELPPPLALPLPPPPPVPAPPSFSAPSPSSVPSAPAPSAYGTARRRWARPSQVAAALVAVAAVATIAVLGLTVADQSRRIDNLAAPARGTELDRAAKVALSQPAARRVQMRSPDGSLTAQAVVLPDGTGYLLDSNLPPLGADRTYQLWAVEGDSTAISVGVLGSHPGVAGFKAAGDAKALAITQEDHGGVVRSAQQPVVVGTLS